MRRFRGPRRILASALVIGSVFAATATPASAAIGDGYTPISPERVLDTREESDVTLGEKIGAGEEIDITLAGAGSIPAANVDSVVLNLTVTQNAKAGFITVFPTEVDAEPPLASSLNFGAGQTTGNAVIAKLGSGGQVTLFNGSSQPVHLIADAVGYFDDVVGDFNGLEATRLLDTRGDAPVAGAGEYELDVTTGLEGEPPATGVSAVVLNVTVTEPTQPGFLTVWPGEGDRPFTSALNFAAKQTVGSLVLATVGADGNVHIYNGASSGTTHLVADVVGWFSSTDEGNDYEAATPLRVLDSRDGTGEGVDEGKLTAGETIQLDLTGTAFEGESAIVLTLVAHQPTAPGFLTVWPDVEGSPPGDTRPLASSLNFATGETKSNLVIAAVGDGNIVNIYNGSAGTVHVIADATGSFPTPAEPEV